MGDSFKNELKKADDNEVVPDVEFVVIEDLIVATCPACSNREEISLSDFEGEEIKDLEILCSECDTTFTLPDLNDLLKLR